jgi:predicted ATPase
MFMEETALHQPALVGREEELGKLMDSLKGAIAGKGSAVLLSGEAGIGKTRLVEEFRFKAAEKGVRILSGAALADQTYPFLMFSKALVDRPLFDEHVYKRFAKLFAVNREGTLVAEASPEGEELDADVFAGMVTAVQDFVRDSFDSSGEGGAGLGRLEYGEMKVLTEHGLELSLTSVFKGAEHDDMRRLMKRALKGVEEGGSVEDHISKLAEARFVVRRDMAGVQLEQERLRIADEILDIICGMSDKGPLLLVLEDLHWADESSLFVLGYLARNVRDERLMIMATTRPAERALGDTLEDMKEEKTLAQLDLLALGTETVSELVNTICPENEFPSTLFESISTQCEGNPFFVTEMMRHMMESGNIAKEEGRYLLLDERYQIPRSIEEMADRRLETLEPDAMTLAEYASCVGREFDRGALTSLSSLVDPGVALEKLLAQGIISMSNGGGEFSHAIFQEVLYKSLGDRWKTSYHKSLGEHYEEAYADRPELVLFELARHFSKTAERQKAFDYCYKAGEKAEAVFAPEQAIVFFNDSLAALSKVKQAGDQEKEIIERLGDLYSLNAEFDNALERYRTVIEMEDDITRKAGLYIKTANTYHGIGDRDMCITESDKGLGHLGDEVCRERANLLGSKSWSYIISSEFDKAVELLEESLGISEKLEDEAATSLAKHRIGTCYARKGDVKKGLVYLEDSLRSREERGDELGAALTRVNIGIIYDDIAELDKALECYHVSLETFNKVKDRYHIALVNNNIGVAYEGRGELDKALEYYQRGLEMSRKIGDEVSLTNVYHNMAVVYCFLNRPEEALEYNEKALELAIRFGSQFHVTHIKRSNANNHILLGNFDKALKSAEESLDSALEIGVKGEEAESRMTLGVAYREKKDWARAVEELDRSGAIIEEIGIEDKLGRLLYEYGLLHGARGETDIAREKLTRALEILEAKGMSTWVKMAKEALEQLK